MGFKTPNEVSRPPLITPSASPPPHVFASRADVAPPSKRQRLASVSRSSSLRRSVSASDSSLDIQKEREASRTRLLDAWSQLAARYSRPLDEDDIVDIRTGEIVKDNGFWRTTRQFKFGEVLAPEYQEETAVEESGDEDGIDELDAFPEEHDYLEDVFARGLQKVALSVGSEDEADLEEFLEAEKRRKEEYGSDLEEGIVETRGVARTGSNSYPPPPATHGLPEDDNEECEELEGEEDEAGVTQDLPGTSSPVYDSGLENSGSEDELDNWEPTEASMVVVARGQVSESLSVDEQSDPGSEVEIVEPLESVKKSLPHKQRTQPIQLHTPPHSYSSVDQPITGRIDIPLPPPPSTPIRPSKPRRGRSNSVSPSKPQARPPQPRSPTSSRRAKTPPDVIELTDDEKSEPFSSRTAPPPPPPLPLPSTVPPTKHTRSRAQSIMPEVVITTLPPRMNHIKDVGVSPVSKHDLDLFRKSIKESIISDALSGNATSRKSPKKPTLAETQPRPPLAGQGDKSVRATKETEKAILSGSRPALCHSPSSPQEGSARSDISSSSHVLRESSPEIGRPPMSPVLGTKRSPAPRRSSVSISPPKNLANLKRKRSSSAYDNSQWLLTPEKSSKEASRSKPREKVTRRADGARSRGSRQSRSKSRRAALTENDDASSSDESVGYQRGHAARRLASVSATMENNYSQYPTPSHNPGMYPPVADLRAQQIITSAMQQLAALLWTPPTHSSPAIPVYPHTPTHHRFSSVGPSFMHSTPDHPHPYPFSFDPSFSKATLPPSSPEIPSSPIKPRERGKSLVSGNHSRERHVSFCFDNKDGSDSESDSESSTSEPLRSMNKQHRGRKEKSLSPQRTSSKAKGKQKVVERSVSPFESEADGNEDVEDKRSTKFTRVKFGHAQVPGSECQSQDDTSTSSRLPSTTKYSSKQRGKHNGGPND